MEPTNTPHEARWIDEAISNLGITADQFRRLPVDASSLVSQQVEQRWVTPNSVATPEGDVVQHWVWWWDHLRQRPYVAQVNGETPRIIPAIAPTDGKPVWLIITDVPGDNLVYEGAVEICMAILMDCPCFEYTVVAQDFSWLICENHHDALIVGGLRAMRKFKQYARDNPTEIVSVWARRRG